MWRDISVSLNDLLFSVSEAMDLADPSLNEHQIRTGFVAGLMARAAGIDYAAQEKLFLAALLHDIGALSPEEKLSIHNFEHTHPEQHCVRGQHLFEEAFWLAPAAPVVRWHHTPMAAHGEAGRSIADSDVFAAQALFLADYLERWIDRHRYILHQSDDLARRVAALAGKLVHPDVVALFDEVARSEDFWLELASSSLGARLKARCPLRSVELDFGTARALAGVFKDMTDFRSRFTAAHSCGTAVCGRGIAQMFRFTGKDLQQIELAGLLHDIGKLVVPNAILCKPSQVDAMEFAVIRQHPYHTHRILSRINGLQQVAEWAALHHERTDGSGYCGRLRQGELDLGAKIVAVADIATALAETRPYRDALGKDDIMRTLDDTARSNRIDGEIVTALGTDYNRIMGAAAEAQATDEDRFAARYADAHLA